MIKEDKASGLTKTVIKKLKCTTTTQVALLLDLSIDPTRYKVTRYKVRIVPLLFL